MQARKLFLSMAALVAVVSLPGCGGGGSSAPAAMTPPGSQAQVLDTPAVLVIARAPSDTGDPLLVGPKGTTVADAEDETSDPIPVAT